MEISVQHFREVEATRFISFRQQSSNQRARFLFCEAEQSSLINSNRCNGVLGEGLLPQNENKKWIGGPISTVNTFRVVDVETV
jgi:hypothetical protein